MSTKSIINLYLFALAAVISFLCACSKNEGTKVITEKAQSRTIVETVSANGKIQPEVDVKISPDVSGEIVELLVKEGQHVMKGDLLIKIKPDIYLSAVDRVTANVNTSKANLENTKAHLIQANAQFTNAESSYQRNKKLFDQGAISQSDYDAALAAHEAARADLEGTEENILASVYSVKSAEASLKEANDNLAKTNIFAPVDGTISKLNVERGERVVGTSQMAGTELMTIANLTEMEVRVEVNENDIIRVQLADTSVIEVDSYGERKFKGIVTEIANSANTAGITADQVTNFTVKIRILQESYKDLIPKKNTHMSPFRPGMTATVDIQTRKAEHIISVPIQAVTVVKKENDKKGSTKDKSEKEEDKVVLKDSKQLDAKKEEKQEECVFLYADGRSKLVKVTSGIQDNDYIQVVSGLKEGDEIITGPYTAISKILKDGMPVKKVDKEELYKLQSRSGK